MFSLIQRVIWLCGGERIPYDANIHEYYRFIIDLYCSNWREQEGRAAAGWNVASGHVATRLLEAQYGLRWWVLTRPGMVFDYYDQFPRYPNPHIRSNGFLVDRRIMLRFEPTDIREKLDACMFESGKDSLTTQLRREGLAAIVVGADGGGWDVDHWFNSGTFRLDNQYNLLVADNQTRDFDRMSAATLLTHQRMTWGEHIGDAPKDFPSLGSKFQRGPLGPRMAYKKSRVARNVDWILLKAVMSQVGRERRAVGSKSSQMNAATQTHGVKISVLIPSKDRFDLLKHAIASVSLQNDSDIEIVVSDNASARRLSGVT